MLPLPSHTTTTTHTVLWYEPQQDVYVRTSYSDWSLSCLISAPPANFRDTTFCYESRDISVSTLSGFGLDDGAIQVLSPADAKNFSSNLCVQTGYGAHPASCTVVTASPFPESKARPGRGADHSPPSSAKVVNVYKLYQLSPLPFSPEVCCRAALRFTLNYDTTASFLILSNSLFITRHIFQRYIIWIRNTAVNETTYNKLMQ
jgi:hypothetical protein